MIDIDQVAKDVSWLAKKISYKIDNVYNTSSQQAVMTSGNQIKKEVALFLLDTNIDSPYELKVKSLEHVIKNEVLSKHPIQNSLEQLINAAEKHLVFFDQTESFKEQQDEEKHSQDIVLEIINDPNIYKKRAFLKKMIEVDEKCLRQFSDFAMSSCTQRSNKNALYHSTASLAGFLEETFKSFWHKMTADENFSLYAQRREKFKEKCVFWAAQVHFDRIKPNAKELQDFEEKIRTGFDKEFEKSEQIIQNIVSEHFNPTAVTAANILKRRTPPATSQDGPSI